MTPAVKLAAFTLLLALMFGMGLAAGDAIGPIDVGTGGTTVPHNPAGHP